MVKTNDIKNFFLMILITSLIASGLLGIFTFLFGEFGATELRLFLTTLSIGGCSLTGLCSSIIYSSEKHNLFSIIGMGTAGLCLVFALFNIWSDFENLASTWTLLLSLIVLTTAFAHISLLLKIKIANKLVQNALTATIIFIVIVTFMLLTLIVGEFSTGEFFYRLLGVFAILDIVGTIITPILNWTQKKVETQ